MNAGKAIFRAMADFSQVRRESAQTARDLGKDASNIDRTYSRSTGFGGTFSRVFARISRDSGRTAADVEGDGRLVDRPWVNAADRVKRAWRDAHREIRKSSQFMRKDLHQVAQEVGQAGTIGGRQFTQALIGIIGGLSTVLPLLGAVGSLALSSVGHVLTLASSLGALAGAGLALPGILAGIGIAGGVLGIALGTTASTLGDLLPLWERLKEGIQGAFWGEAEAGIRSLIANSMTPLMYILPSIARTWGLIASEAASTIDLMANKLGILPRILQFTNQGLKAMQPGIMAIIKGMFTLADIGATYLPRLGQWFTDLGLKFNAFVQVNAANGNLFRWIDAGIQGFKDLGSVLVSIASMFSSLTEAARAGGAISSLSGLAAGLRDVAAVMERPVFQTTMATLFAGAEAGSAGLLRALGPIGAAFERGAPAMADFLRLGGEIAGLFVGGLFTALSDPAFGAGLVSFMEHLKTGVQTIVPLLPGLTIAFGAFLAALGPITEVLGPSLITVFTGIGNAIALLLTTFEPFLVMIASSPVVLGLLIGAFGATRAASAALTAAGNIQRVAMGAWWVMTKLWAAGMWLAHAAQVAFTFVVGGLPKVLALARTGMLLLSAAMAANPIGFVIAAITALVAGLVWFFTQTELGRKLWAGFMSGMRDAAAAVSEWFTGTFVPALTGAWDSIVGAWKGAVAWFKGIWDGISTGASASVTGVTDAWTGVGEWFNGIWTKIKDYFALAWEGVKIIAANVVAWFTGTLVPGIVAVVQALAAPYVWLYEKIIKPTFDSILVIANGLWMGLKGIFELLGALFTKVVGPYFVALYESYVKPVFDWISAKISSVINTVVSFLTTRLAALRAMWSTVWQAVSDRLGAAWNWISSKVTAVWNAISSWLGGKLSAFQSAWSAAWQAVSNRLGAAWDWISSRVTAVWNTISSWLAGRLAAFQSAWSTAWNWVSTRISDVWNGISRNVTNVWNTLIGWLNGRISAFQTSWSLAWGFIRDRASAIWTDLKNRITGTWDTYIRPLFNAVGDFVTKTLPARFQTGIDAIGKIWNKLKELARVPIAFVIEDVINRGLIGNFNKIARKLKVTELPTVAMPFGLATGGMVPGSSPTPTADNVPIMATAGEFMLRHFAAQKLKRKNPGALEHINRTGELPVQHLATGGEVAGEAAFFHGNAANVAAHGAYYLNVPAALAPWNFKGAASLWDGASGAKVKIGMGRHQGWASERERGGGILGYTTGSNIDMSPSWMRQLGDVQRRTVAAHEMGHAMGLPHTYRQSIMQPNLGQMASIPSAFDIRNMQTLFPGGSGKAGSGEGGQSGLDVFAGLKKLLDGALELLKNSVPGSGPFVDVAKGVGTKAFDAVVDFAKNQLANIKEIAENIWSGIKSLVPGLGARAEDETLYDTGGKVKTGRTVVRNDSGKPEALLTSAQWAQVMALIAIASQLTKTVAQSQSMLVPPVVNFGALLGQPDTSVFGPPPTGGASGRPAPLNENAGGARYHVDNLNIHNPKPEPASESLPKTIRKLSSVGVPK